MNPNMGESPVEYTTKEGGVWYPFPRKGVENDAWFAIKYADGRIYERVSGWRSGVPVHAVGDPLPAAVAAVDAAVNNAIEREIEPSPARRYPVYVASRINHFGMWKELRRKWKPDHVDIVSSWIDKIDPVHGDSKVSPLRFGSEWIENYREVTAAKAVICYAAPGDVLRGALIEVGIAMGQHKPIIIVGPLDHPYWGSWQYHPLVTYTAELSGALSVIKTWLGRT